MGDQMSPIYIDAIDYSTFSHRLSIDYSLIYTPVLFMQLI